MLLSACGGGGGTTTATTSVATGLAAVGAPISAGTLSAIDVNGLTASTAIADDGTYSLNFLASLRTPILLRAEGVSGGRTTFQFGVITSATDTTVNVTPVSTAVVAQVMQADPGVVFAAADTAKIALLTTAQVAAVNTIIGNALSVARTAAGISGNGAIDFLNTPFVADKTGLDKLLDLVRISVQPDRSVKLKNKTADGVTTVSSVGAVSGSLGTIGALDTAGIDALGRALEASFANNAVAWGDPLRSVNPSQSVVNLFSSGFLHGGENASTIISNIARQADDMGGAKFSKARIFNCPNVAASPVCEVAFNVTYADLSVEPFIFPVIYESGSWKIYGNQAPVTTNYASVVYRTVSGSNAATTRSGFNIEAFDTASIGGTSVGFIKAWFGTDTSSTPEFVFVNPNRVTGSCNGSNLGGIFRILTDPNNNNSCAENFAELSNSRIDQLRASFATVRPKITVRYYNTSGNWIANSEHVITIEALPLKPSEVTDGHFATVTSASWSEFAAINTNNTPFTLAVTKSPFVGLEEVRGARPIDSPNTVQGMPFSTVRVGSSWSVWTMGSGSARHLTTTTRDEDGRMYWYQRKP
jgi:hypothetical protein